MALKYKIHDQQAYYFVTFTVVEWVDIFTRDPYRNIFINSVKYCQQHKGLVVCAWVIMTNHVHMIIGSTGNKIEDIIRDMKSYTSRHIRLEMDKATYESRKNWIMPIFYKAGRSNTNNDDFQFWIQDNHPVEMATAELMQQRINYIHNNPVRAGFVVQPEHWLWSSAHDYCGGTQGLLDMVMAY